MATSRVSLVNTLTLDQRKSFLRYAKYCAEQSSGQLSDFRSLLLYRDRAYQRQLNVTAEHIQAVRANMSGDSRKIADMTVPIVMPQVESAVAYQAGVFLTSYPIFGVISSPANQSAALQFETALGDQSIKFGWARELIKVLRDGYKYNFGVATVDWKKLPLKQIVTDTSINAAGMAAIKDYAYGGNAIVRRDPYNSFMDMSVAPANLAAEGEYYGENSLISRVQLKRMLATLDPQKTTSAREAYESSFGGQTEDMGATMSYYVPEVNKYLKLGTPHFGVQNWGQWMGLSGGNQRNPISYKDHYLLTTFYCRAVASDFGGTGNTVKVYKAYIINWCHVIFVEELNLAHDLLPAFVMQPYEDGLGYQTQSMLDNALPFQDMSSALWNISLESKRRLIFDRLVYNPRMIDKKDIDPVSAVSRIPLRNAAMAKDGNEIARAVYQIPYREDNSGTNLQMADMISGMADQATGQNKVDRGQFQKGNKTKQEFDTTMANSNSRQQLSALSIEHQFFTPVKEAIKANTLQFQGAGSFMNRDTREPVNVDPVELRKAMLEFKMTDGQLPADKMMNSELLMVFLQTAQALPAVATEYDVMGMFMYWAKLRGAYWLEDFKRNPAQQQQFLSTLAQTQVANNAQPTPPAAPQQ